MSVEGFQEGEAIHRMLHTMVRRKNREKSLCESEGDINRA